MDFSTYTSEELRNAGICALLGGSASIATAVMMSEDKEINNWFRNVKKPKYSLKQLTHWSIGSTVVGVTMPAATYLIYLEGTHHREVQVALGLHVVFSGLGYLNVLAFKKHRCLPLMVNIGTAATATVIAMQYLYCNISPTAGRLLAPATLWCIYSCVCGQAMKCMNVEDGDKPAKGIGSKPTTPTTTTKDKSPSKK